MQSSESLCIRHIKDTADVTLSGDVVFWRSVTKDVLFWIEYIFFFKNWYVGYKSVTHEREHGINIIITK